MRPVVLMTAGGASLAMARHLPSPSTVTAAPSPHLVELRLRDDAPNPLSVAQVLLTAFPRSLYEIAATNPTTIPSIIWQEFLDGSVPSWFANLPEDVRSYLINAYIGTTAPPDPATSISSPSTNSASPSLSSPSFSTPTSQASATASPPSDSPSATSTALVSSSNTPISSNPAISSHVPTASSSRSASLSFSRHHSNTHSPSSTLISSVSNNDSSSHTISSTLYSATSPSKTDITTIASATVTDTGLPPPAVEPSERPSESGLSRSSKIGIGVGVPFGILAIAGLFGLCFLRRRRRRAFDEKETDDRTPFVTREQLHDGSQGGSYNPYGPYAPLADDSYGFQGATVTGGVANTAGPGAMAGAASRERRRRSLTPIDTNPFQDPSPDSNPSSNTGSLQVNNGNGNGAAFTNLRSSPHRKLRRGSGASLRSIEEEANEDGDIATVGAAASWNRGGNANSPFVSPVEPSRDLMDPPFQRETPEDVAQQKYAAFRSGSLKQNRRSSGSLPIEEPARNDPPRPQNESSHRPLERRRSLSIGGGYRSLPSPHLQQPSQTYLLPRGEWLEDGEDLPRNRF